MDCVEWFTIYNYAYVSFDMYKGLRCGSAEAGKTPFLNR